MATVHRLEPTADAPRLIDRAWNEVAEVLGEPGLLTMAFQPIASLATGTVVGFEALSRFRTPARRDPASWFAQAWSVGLGAALEAHALELALDAPDRPPGAFLTVNLSPSALASPEVQQALARPLSGLVVEITEHEAVEDYGDLTGLLAVLRARGARIAVDDAGAGYAGLDRVMRLSPDIIKLDRALVSGIDRDPAKSALVEAMVSFAGQTGAVVCAEGVETLEELAALARLDVGLGQGWALARPAPTWVAIAPDATLTCDDVLRDALAGIRVPQDRRRGELLFERISADLSAATTLDEVAKLVGALAEALHADEVALSLYDAENESVIGVTDHQWIFEHDHYRLAEYPATRHVLETRCSLQILVNDEYADPDEVALLRETGYASMLMVPIVFRNRSLGIIEAYTRTERPWTRSEITRARLACSHLGATIFALQVADGAGIPA
jgi:EAL domain-containing protein (putative c-di-GMP-specific phosphodiesterase class I)